MSSIINQKVGKHTYLYESVSYRNEKKEPRNKRKIIGKIDPATGKPIFKTEFLERREAIEAKKAKEAIKYSTDITDIEQKASIISLASFQADFISQSPLSGAYISINDVYSSSIQEYGAIYLLRQLAYQIGLSKILQKVLPDYWEEIINLAAYTLTTGNPFSYDEDCAVTDAHSVECAIKTETARRIDELLNNITLDERDSFYRMWCMFHNDKEYLVINQSLASTYSKFIVDNEWNYNDCSKKRLQIDCCTCYGNQSKYPIYQIVNGDGHNDSVTVNNILYKFHTLTGVKPEIIVMDERFYSEKDIDAMLSIKPRINFIMTMPMTSKISQDLVNSVKNDIDTFKNTIVDLSNSLRGVTKLRRWNDNNVYAHIYYNAKKAYGIREALYAHVVKLREQAEDKPEKYLHNPDYTKYLEIKRSKKEQNGFTVNARENIIAAELAYAGWMIIVCNFITDTKEAFRIFRQKNAIEININRSLQILDTYNEDTLNDSIIHNKLFIYFISTILLAGIHKIMINKKLYKKMTLIKLLRELSGIKFQIVDGVRVLSRETEEQRLIYEAFGNGSALL